MGETYPDVAEDYYIVEADFRQRTGVVIEVLDLETAMPARAIEVLVFDGEGDA